MTLEFIHTNNGNNFIIEQTPDTTMSDNNILIGYVLRLFAEKIFTDLNIKGVVEYSNYVSESPIRICKITDIKNRRPASDDEVTIYTLLKKKDKLTKEHKKYLRDNYFTQHDHTTNNQLNLFK